MTIRVLLLGGTFEARQLAQHLAGRGDMVVTLSLAGRTAHPLTQPVPVRIGGFGGVSGLIRYLQNERIGALVDATHPYAAQISRNAAAAAKSAEVPLLGLRRPAWEEQAGDRWRRVTDVTQAVAAIGSESRRVFVALGRQEIGPFAAAPQHRYLIRSVDPIDPPLSLPRVDYLLDRGPFCEADERALLQSHRIDAIVAKNSGGTATYGKIAAARGLGIDVILLHRPDLPEVETVATVEAAIDWLAHRAALESMRGE